MEGAGGQGPSTLSPGNWQRAGSRTGELNQEAASPQVRSESIKSKENYNDYNMESDPSIFATLNH